MSASPQSALVYALARIGLAKTLLATKGRNRYLVHRLDPQAERLTLLKIGELEASGAPVIGRVSQPQASLPLAWRESLTFYGRWYDELAPVDPGGALRIKIAQLPLTTLLTQIQRDDRYALVGTYYAVFQAIMTAKQRVPLILLDTYARSPASLPVILPTTTDDRAYGEMKAVLHLMLGVDAQRAVVDDGVKSAPPAMRQRETSPPV